MTQYLLTPAQFTSYLYDVFLTVYFFRRIYNAKPSRHRFALALIPLLFFFPLMMTPFPIQTMPMRYFYRWALIFLNLLLYRVGCWQRCLYFSALCSLSFLAVQNFVISSKFINSYQSYDAVLNFCVTCVMEYIMPFVIFHAVSANLDFEKMQRIRLHQAAMVALLVPTGLYVKQSFFVFADANTAPGLSDYLYPVIISLLTLAIVANFDRFFILRAEKEKQTLIDLSRQYQYQNLQDQLAAHKEIRHLHHDMKNHLLTLSALGNEQQSEYIQSLLHQMDNFGNLVETNNPTLNVLLSQKVRIAREKHIRVKADLDLSPADFLEPIDICSIFGNALDNAIEAAEQLEDDQSRYISIKGGAYAGLFVVRITNSCTGNLLKTENGLLRTTKKDKAQHGIGLENIRRALQRYQGVLTYGLEGDTFVLKFSLPLEQPEETKPDAAL